MASPLKPKPIPQKQEPEKPVGYEKPAILYEGYVSTRAGSPLRPPDGEFHGFDPADLFGR